MTSIQIMWSSDSKLLVISKNYSLGHKFLGHLLFCALKPSISTASLTFFILGIKREYLSYRHFSWRILLLKTYSSWKVAILKPLPLLLSFVLISSTLAGARGTGRGLRGLGHEGGCLWRHLPWNVTRTVVATSRMPPNFRKIVIKGKQVNKLFDVLLQQREGGAFPSIVCFGCGT